MILGPHFRVRVGPKAISENKIIKKLPFSGIYVRFTNLKVSPITPFLDPKMNVFGSQNRSVHLIDRALIDFQASIFGCRFRVGLQQKKGVHFRMKSLPENGFRIWFYTSVMAGNKHGYKSKQ